MKDEETVMASGSKQQYKQYTINNAEDACAVLGSLITSVYVDLEKYQEYIIEASELFERLNASGAEFVSEKEYDDINDKLLYRQREILRHVADRQKSSFSYMELRPKFESMGLVSTSLSPDMETILREFLDIRNWTFHNPQSLLVAAREASIRNIPQELQQSAIVMPHVNPVVITKVKYYKIEMLVTLIAQADHKSELFSSILESMKNDYQEMYKGVDKRRLAMTGQSIASDVEYRVHEEIVGLESFQSDVAQLSMAIQKSKYDGTDDSFYQFVLRKICPEAETPAEDDE